MDRRKTKIVATIGPSSSDEEVLENIIDAGVDICRINFSHGSHEDHQKVIDRISGIRRRTIHNTGILADLQGPKLRIGEMENGEVDISDGDIIYFTTEERVGTKDRVFITYPDFPKDVEVGEKILVDDGKLELEVLSTNREDEVKTVVTHGGPLRSKKGVNLPNTQVSLPSLTEKDLKDLDFALKNKVEWIGLSFVRSAADIIELKHRIAKARGFAKVIAKIEKPEAIQDIDNIIKEADGIMVARGDLGVEVPLEQVPVIQKLIVKKSLEAAKPVIIATQMMESMITDISPTRAEVNDVANSVMDGADALMLSGETSVGDHPIKVVETMAKIIEYIETYENIYHREHLPVPKSERYVSDNICLNATELALETEASAIITMTHSGYTAFRISSYRPNTDIFIFTDNYSILNMLNLVWGVRGFYYDKYLSTDHTIADIKHILVGKGLVKKGQLVINIASMPINERGQSNMLKLSYVE